ncbi:MAG: hypothetical protein ACQEXJ_10330 [Myxococcota bacterium]
MSKTVSDQTFLKEFFRALNLRAIDPRVEEQRKRYVSMYDRPDTRHLDPVRRMARDIEWGEHESVVLFSGFRGSGKSTELRRLRWTLEKDHEAIVVYCDMMDYVNMNAPPDVPDMLLAMAGAFAEAVVRDELLDGDDPLEQSYWERMVHFLTTTEVELPELKAGAKGAGVGVDLKLALKDSPSFQKKLQESLATRVGQLVAEVRGFYADTLARLRAEHGEDKPIALLFDSLEHIKGTSTSAPDVAKHLEATYSRVDQLRIPGVHAVFTVPPWLKVRAPYVFHSYDDVVSIPSIMVRRQDGGIRASALDSMAELIARRGDWERLLTREQLDRVVLASGGHFRDLFRILQGILRLCADRDLPASDETVERALDEVRNSYLPIADQDAAWLQRVADSGEANLPGQDHLGDLARFFDNHYVLTYRHGDEWYQIHPLIREAVASAAARAEEDAQSGP